MFGELFLDAQYSDNINTEIEILKHMSKEYDLNRIKFKERYSKKSVFLSLLHIIRKLNKVECKLRKPIKL